MFFPVENIKILTESSFWERTIPTPSEVITWEPVKSETFPVFIYFSNGKIDQRFEWNKKQTKTCLIEEYYENGALKSRYEWNPEHSDTDLVEYHELVED